jgi:hypothetical protein
LALLLTEWSWYAYKLKYAFQQQVKYHLAYCAQRMNKMTKGDCLGELGKSKRVQAGWSPTGVAAIIEREQFDATIKPEQFEHTSVAQNAIYRYAKTLSRVVPVAG